MTYPGIENDPAALAANEDMLAIEQRRKEREAEYGKYVAITDIPWGTVKAFTPGMQVPVSTVERLKWDQLGLVAERTSQAGREVLERTGTATSEELERWKAEDKAAADKARTAEAKTAAKASTGGAS